jgi:hypothetical protein
MILHDGAMAYTASSTMQVLCKFFGGHIISQNLWPSQSPDLSLPDFYLWSFSEECVQKQPAQIRRMETKY